MNVRLLGKCPRCGADDSIAINHDNGEEKAACEKCGCGWDDWLQLERDEKKKGNNLIFVWVNVGNGCAMVHNPRIDEIPCARVIVNVLNVAVMVRFKLGVSFATEGGLNGIVKHDGGKGYVDLTNACGYIGLMEDDMYSPNPVRKAVLRWYGDLLNLLFEDELVVDGKSFGRGAILKLSGEAPVTKVQKATNLLWLVLYKKTGSKGFADEVFLRMRAALRQSLVAPYIAGLTDEQIAKFFVPPPWR